MRNILFILFLLTVVSSCRKARVTGKLQGNWDATYYKINGVEQDITGGIFIEFKLDGYGVGEGGTFKNQVAGSSGYLNADFYKYIYVPKNKRLILFYETGLKEELKIEKMKVLPNGLSYSDEESAKEEYMILSKGNEEWKFVKRFEE